MLKKSLFFVICLPALFISEDLLFSADNGVKSLQLQATQFHFGPDLQSFKSFSLDGLSIQKESRNFYFIQLKKELKVKSDLLLDFENSSPNLLKDKNNHYKIIHSSYRPEEKNSPEGKRNASFSGKNTYINIATDKNKILGSEYFKEDFFISFYLKTGNIDGNTVIMSKEYLAAGRAFGITFRIKNGFIHTDLNNLFYSTQKNPQGIKTFSVLLKSKKKLTPDKWHLVTLYIDSNSGKIILYLDGDESVREEVDEVYTMGFHKHDTTPLKIGSEFYGSLDMLMIANGKPEFSLMTSKYSLAQYDDYNLVASQINGTAVSKVFKTRFSHSSPLSFLSKSEIPNGTSIEHYVRFSEELFLVNDDLPAWVPIEKLKLKKGNVSSVAWTEKPDFQYFQYMFKMKADYKGVLSPKLLLTKINYSATTPPRRPAGLRVVSTDNDKMEICLAWNSNHESNVKNGGGYIIHYGISPERMVSSLYVNESGEKITGLRKEKNINLLQNYMALSQCIDNKLISINAEREMEKNNLTFKKGIGYYFKISSYNNKYNRFSSPDQKSAPSAVVHSVFRSM